MVIWDNLSVHQRRQARFWVEAEGAQVLFLPSYSPDFNSIELAFNTLKTRLRETGARTRDDLEATITAALETITSQDAAAWFAHCEYQAPDDPGQPL